MTIKEIIDGLKFTVDMFLFDPSTGETFTEPRNDMDKTTIDACKGAIELLEQTRWIPCNERLPEKNGNYLVTVESSDGTASIKYQTVEHYGPEWLHDKKTRKVIAWMPIPEPYKKAVKEGEG